MKYRIIFSVFDLVTLSFITVFNLILSLSVFQRNLQGLKFPFSLKDKSWKCCLSDGDSFGGLQSFAC